MMNNVDEEFLSNPSYFTKMGKYHISTAFTHDTHYDSNNDYTNNDNQTKSMSSSASKSAQEYGPHQPMLAPTFGREVGCKKVSPPMLMRRAPSPTKENEKKGNKHQYPPRNNKGSDGLLKNNKFEQQMQQQEFRLAADNINMTLSSRMSTETTPFEKKYFYIGDSSNRHQKPSKRRESDCVKNVNNTTITTSSLTDQLDDITCIKTPDDDKITNVTLHDTIEDKDVLDSTPPAAKSTTSNTNIPHNISSVLDAIDRVLAETPSLNYNNKKVFPNQGGTQDHALGLETRNETARLNSGFERRNTKKQLLDRCNHWPPERPKRASTLPSDITNRDAKIDSKIDKLDNTGDNMITKKNPPKHHQKRKGKRVSRNLDRLHTLSVSFDHLARTYASNKAKNSHGGFTGSGTTQEKNRLEKNSNNINENGSSEKRLEITKMHKAYVDSRRFPICTSRRRSL